MILIGMVLACSACASALNPSLDISQYAHTSWKVRDGFAQGFIGSIAQTPDGYLWLGTEFGLLRFDGVRAIPWQPPAGQRLPAERVISLLTAQDGTLWIGTGNGLAIWNGSKFAQYREFSGYAVFSLVEDHEGTIWVGGTAFAAPIQSKLCQIRGGRIHCYGEDGRFGLGFERVYEDSKGNLWGCGNDGLWKWKPAREPQFASAGQPIRCGGVIEDDQGELLIAARDGLKRLVNGKAERHAVPGIDWQFTPNGLFRSSDGSLWIRTDDRGLIHVHRGRADWFAQPDGLSSNNIGTIFEDREGNIWVGTADGLDRFRDRAVPTISTGQGLADEGVWSVLAARDGSLWFGSSSGVTRLRDGEVTIYRRPYPEQSAALQSHSQTRSTSVVRVVGNSGLPAMAESLFEDDAGRIWVTTRKGVVRWDGTRFGLLDGIPGEEVYAISEDRQGSLWLSSEQHFGELMCGRCIRNHS